MENTTYLEILEKYIDKKDLSNDKQVSNYHGNNETNELNEQSNHEELGDIVSEETDPNAKPLNCRTCNGTDFWQRLNDGGWVCSKCHPQISGNKITERVETKETK